MKTLYWYVLKEILPTFLLCVAVLTLIFFINKLFLLLDLVMNKKVPLFDTLLLYLSLIPFMLSLTVPMSMMVATLLAFGRLSSDMEVTALKSSGVHLFRLILPVLVFGLIMAAAMLYFNHKVLPAANFAFKKIHYRILQNQANVAVHERVFIDKFEGYQFYIDRQDSGGLFSDVTVFNRLSPKAPLQTTLAKTGELKTDKESLQMFFHLRDGTVTWDNVNYHTYNRLYFDRYIIRLNLENQLATMSDVKKDYEEMNLVELRQEAETAADPGRKRYVSIEYQKRLSLPFACLALAWFCAPLGLWARLKGFLGFVLGILMIFVYYLMFFFGEILAEKGDVPASVGLWWPNVALALAGFLVYYLVVAEHSAFGAFRNRR